MHPGQLVSAALALAPDLVLRDRDPAAETAALAAVATWATQFTPTVSLAPPDAVLAEIGGSLRLFGGLPRLAAHFARGAHDLGYAARLAFAPTPTAALLLFARARGRSGPAPTSRRSLALASLAHLGLDADALATLGRGRHHHLRRRLRAATRRPRAPRRRGVRRPSTARGGSIADPRPPFVPPPRYEGRLELPRRGGKRRGARVRGEPARPRARRLAAGTRARHRRAVARARARASCRDPRPAPATTVRFALAAPAREPAHLITVLRERLARVALPAPVVAITLASEATAPLAGRNLGLLPGDEALADGPAPRPAARAARRGRRHPRRRRMPSIGPSARGNEDRTRPDPRDNGRRKAPRKIPPDPRTAAARAPRPRPWLLAEPEPLGHHLEAQPWVLRDGPERIESGWWDGADVRRDYFVAENPRGERVWIYRDHRYGIDDGEWFLHGLFA